MSFFPTVFSSLVNNNVVEKRKQFALKMMGKDLLRGNCGKVSHTTKQAYYLKGTKKFFVLKYTLLLKKYGSPHLIALDLNGPVCQIGFCLLLAYSMYCCYCYSDSYLSCIFERRQNIIRIRIECEKSLLLLHPALEMRIKLFVCVLQLVCILKCRNKQNMYKMGEICMMIDEEVRPRSDRKTENRVWK